MLCHFIPIRNPLVYVFGILLGIGGSLSLVTCLAMLAELIGENVVSKFIVQKLKRFNNVGQVNNADNVTHILTLYTFT